jgi:hypothetical protein
MLHKFNLTKTNSTSLLSFKVVDFVEIATIWHHVWNKSFHEGWICKLLWLTHEGHRMLDFKAVTSYVVIILLQVFWWFNRVQSLVCIVSMVCSHYWSTKTTRNFKLKVIIQFFISSFLLLNVTFNCCFRMLPSIFFSIWCTKLLIFLCNQYVRAWRFAWFVSCCKSAFCDLVSSLIYCLNYVSPTMIKGVWL